MKEQLGGTPSRERLQRMSLAQIQALREQSKPRSKRTRMPDLSPRKRDSDLPLSFAQERLWFLDQLDLVGPAYNMPLALQLDGELNVQAFEQSLLELLRRHESLRTHFESILGRPVQIVDPPPSVAFDLRDLSKLEESERRLTVQRLSAEEVQRRFDLSTGPLLRSFLLKLTPHRHVLLLTIHHIVADGWSLGVLNDELSVLYNSYSQGKPSPLPDLPVQYADYAIWQREWMQGDVLESQLRYWREQLAGAPPQLNLPMDRPRPAVPSFNGALLSFEVSAELRTALERLARDEGATLFMVVLAVYQVLLARYTGQRDIAVGSAVAGRRNVSLEPLIGFFVNALVLRTDLSGNLTFRELLARVKEVTLGAYANQDVPFEELVKELRPERNLSHQPLFQTLLTVQNYPYDQLHLAGIRWSWLWAERVTSKFDVVLYIYEMVEGLRGVVEYATDLFDEGTIARMATHFRVLLGEFATDPDREIA